MKMENKTLYREYFPGYMGHIPFKNDTIGMTVGATNEHIKSFLTREPEYDQKLVPTAQSDYSYYNKRYFTDNMSKDYNLEEEKVFSNKSKEARTWINGSKYKIYPQHIPGYQGHIPGIYGSNILGTSYAKATSVAIKGDYCKERDLPSDEKYKTITKLYYGKPKMRTEEEESHLKKTTEGKPKVNDVTAYNATNNIIESMNSIGSELPESFKKAMNYDTKPIDRDELPYIVGYKGFRRGVKSGNYYGKNFREVSTNSMNAMNNMLSK